MAYAGSREDRWRALLATTGFGGSPGEEFVQNEHRRKRQSQCTHENVSAG
jgi:hypothetical protein